MDRLFLDTARMGRPSRQAIDAVTGLSQYWAVNGLSAEFDRFLHEGFDADQLEQYPSLCSWHGIAELKNCLLRCAGFDTNWNVLLANRSSKLFELPVEILKKRRRRVMCFESMWPRYRKVLTQRVETVIFEDSRVAHQSVLIAEAIDLFRATNCEALVLPTVTHFGKVFPYAELIDQLADSVKVDMVILDGAQEFGHMPVQPLGGAPLFYVTCTQKWLRSGLTAGVAFASPNTDWQDTSHAIRETDDPLLKFACGSAGEECYGETVAVSPLVACRAAIDGLTPERVKHDLRVRHFNRRNLFALLKLQGDHDQEISPSGMLTFSMGHDEPRPARELRQAFLDLGIVLSAFPGGLIRLSMPESKFTDAQLQWIESSFDSPMVNDHTHFANNVS